MISLDGDDQCFIGLSVLIPHMIIKKIYLLLRAPKTHLYISDVLHLEEHPDCKIELKLTVGIKK